MITAEDRKKLIKFLKDSEEVIDGFIRYRDLLELGFKGHYVADRLKRFNFVIDKSWGRAKIRLEKKIAQLSATSEDKTLDDTLVENGLAGEELSFKLDVFDHEKDELDKVVKLVKRFKEDENQHIKEGDMAEFKEVMKSYRSILFHILGIIATIAGSFPGFEFLSELADLKNQILEITKDYVKLKAPENQGNLNLGAD